MALYLLVALVGVLPLVLLAALGVGALRAARAAALARFQAQVFPREARAGDTLEVRARVTPRRAQELVVTATLSCTLFDHRRRQLFARTVTLAPRPGQGASDELVGELLLPRTALKTGAVGDELSTMFSEEARRLLAFWTVVVEVRQAGGQHARLARRSLPLEVSEGRALSTDERWITELVLDTFASLRDDLVFNWMVKVAAHDGEITAGERELLREALRRSHGIGDAAAADERIERERTRTLDLDPEMMRRHVPVEHRVELYKLLYAVAWRDGRLDEREHELLTETLRDFGLDHHHVREVELEVLRGLAAKSLA